MPVLVDSRYRLLEYHGLTTCTPNESEVEQVLGIRINDDANVLERAGRTLLRRTGMRAVLISNSDVPAFEAAEPDAVITRLAELLNHLDRWS